MQLVFKSENSTKGLSNWLKTYLDLQDSLLLEIDLTKSAFVAKGYTTDHCVVKYSEIPFSDAGVSILNIFDENGNDKSLAEWNATSTNRINVPIFKILKSFVSVIDTYNVDHVIKFNFGVYSNEEGDQYNAVSVEFKSKFLEMIVPCANITEFEKLSDDTFFNNINVIESPMTFNVSSEGVSSLISVSNIFSVDAKSDILRFVCKKDDEGDWALFATDKKEGTSKSFEYLIGYLTEGEGVEREIPIYRNNFILATKTKNNFKVVIGAEDRLRISNAEGVSDTIISSAL